jgi:hypothetical protein
MTVETIGAASPVQPADAATTLVNADPVATANAQLTGLVNNKEWAAKFMAGDVEARKQFDGLTRTVAGAGDDTNAAIAGKATPPMIDALVEGELPFHARSAVIEDLRASGLSDAAIAEALTGTVATPAEIEQAKLYQRMRHSDPEWVKNLLAGDWQARKEQLLLSVILSKSDSGRMLNIGAR